VGTAEIMATVSLLDVDRLDAGQTGWAQLFLEDAAVTVWGQPFVVRDSSAEHTLGGGHILQPTANKLRRGEAALHQRLEALGGGEVLVRCLAAVWFAGFAGCQASELVRLAGLPVSAIDQVRADLVRSGQYREWSLPPHRVVGLHTDRTRELAERVLAVLQLMHTELPLHTNHDRQKMLARLDYIGDDSLLQAITDDLLRQKQLVGDGKRLARADFKPKLSANQRKLKDLIVAELAKAPFSPPDLASFGNQAGANAVSLKEIATVAVAEGWLVKITDEIYLHAEAEAAMRETVRQHLADGAGATVAQIRDWLGTTRKYAVPLCEYLDRIGLTKRSGDLRTLT
jgi:selenocysteine-specific elongation factor